jgi:hypothetical protein
MVRGIVVSHFLLYCLNAQSFTGLITGTVQDPSRSAVPNARLVFTHVGTNRTQTAISAQDGKFVSPPLEVGEYRLETTAAGFKVAVRGGIVMEVAQTAVLNIMLEVGAAAERIEVVADAPLLESATSDLGKVVDNRRIRDLPLNTRNVFSLVALTPGFVGSAGIRYDNQEWSVYGARTRMMEVVVDGVSAATPTINGYQATASFPPVDAIQEFKVMGSNPPAEYGRSLGTVLNIVYKSGTNQLHGSAFNFLRNSVLDANNFFAKSRGEKLSSFKRNQFGGTLSGPIRKNRTFYMGSYEGLRESSFRNTLVTVPTDLERNGDFSRTLAANRQLVQVFDPFSTASVDGRLARAPFAGNMIPRVRMDPVALNASKFLPQANTAGDPVTNQFNYSRSGAFALDINSFDARGDHNISDTQRLGLRYSHRTTDEIPPNLFPDEIQAANGRTILGDRPRNVVVEYSNVLSPANVFTVRVGFSRVVFNLANQSLGFLPSSLGLPSIIDQLADVRVFPQFSIAGYQGLGGGDHRRSSLSTHLVNSSFSHTRRDHTFKFGFDGRLIRANVRETRTPAGVFTFTQAMTQGPDPTRASATAGNGYASMLLGAGSGEGILYRSFKDQAAQSYYMAWFVQDDWRITSKLTLNLGLRYDFDTPKTERFNRLNYFDPDVQSPLAGKVPGFPDLRGGLIHVGVNGVSRRGYKWYANQLAPRLGLAYQLNAKTVLRGGYAHIYGSSFGGAAVHDVPYGFGSETPWITSLDGVTPLNLLRNPYPNGLREPEGASRGLLAAVGQGFRAKFFDDPTGWTQQWNFTIQRTLPGGLFLETGYIGTRGRGLEFFYNANELHPSHLALGSRLTELVPNPFFGIVNEGIFTGQRVSRAQLLRPYPQFLDLSLAQNLGGDSWYHAGQLTVKKRMGLGLQFEGSYVWSKTMDRGEETVQSHYRLATEKAIAARNVPHRLVFSYLYELPFGRGRYFGSSAPAVAQWLIGGWQFNGITTLQSGTPLRITGNNTAGAFGGVVYANNLGRTGEIKVDAHERLNRWFDTTAFRQPDPFTFGNLSPRVSDVRTHHANNSDLSLFKEFRGLAERLRVQFRAEALNAFNRVTFSAPNAVVTNPAFGRVTTQANAPRQIQFGLKLIW